MALNPNIILAGRGPDVVNALRGGAIAGQQINDFRHQNALRDTVRQHGAGIMQGDQEALSAYAQFDPQAALGVQSTRQNMEATQQRMDMLSREEQRAIQAQAAQMDAAQRQAEAQRIEQAVATGLQAQTPEQWDAFVGSVAPDLVGQFENREMIAARYMSVADSLKRFDEANAAPEAQSSLGKFFTDQSAGLIPEGVLPPQSGTNVTVTNNTGGTDAFYEAADKSAAQTMTTLAEQGSVAGQNLARLSTLRNMVEETPTGLGASVSAALGDWGIQTDGLSEVQAMRALINQMVPAQRPAGSGPMSDRDLELFKQSVPSLINSPDGNRRIIETMTAISEYQMEEAAIATAVLNREITPAEGRSRLQALGNPLSEYKSEPSEQTTEAAPQRLRFNPETGGFE